VPGDDGLRLHDDEVPSPVAAEAASEDPEELVAPAKGSSLARRAGQDGELVAQQQVLEDQVAASAEGRAQQVDQDGENSEHHREHGRSRTGPASARSSAPQQPNYGVVLLPPGTRPAADRA